MTRPVTAILVSAAPALSLPLAGYPCPRAALATRTRAYEGYAYEGYEIAPALTVLSSVTATEPGETCLPSVAVGTLCTVSDKVCPSRL
jgi:hypothetical protein